MLPVPYAQWWRSLPGAPPIANPKLPAATPFLTVLVAMIPISVLPANVFRDEPVVSNVPASPSASVITQTLLS